MLANHEPVSALQAARQRYEQKFFRLTVRLGHDFNQKVQRLSQVHGGNDEAIEYAINNALVSNNIHRQEYQALEIENADLHDQIDKLKLRIQELESQLNDAEAAASGDRATQSQEQPDDPINSLTVTSDFVVKAAIEAHFNGLEESFVLDDLGI